MLSVTKMAVDSANEQSGFQVLGANPSGGGSTRIELRHCTMSQHRAPAPPLRSPALSLRLAALLHTSQPCSQSWTARSAASCATPANSSARGRIDCQAVGVVQPIASTLLSATGDSVRALLLVGRATMLPCLHCATANASIIINWPANPCMPICSNMSLQRSFKQAAGCRKLSGGCGGTQYSSQFDPI